MAWLCLVRGGVYGVCGVCKGLGGYTAVRKGGGGEKNGVVRRGGRQRHLAFVRKELLYEYLYALRV